MPIEPTTHNTLATMALAFSCLVVPSRAAVTESAPQQPPPVAANSSGSEAPTIAFADYVRSRIDLYNSKSEHWERYDDVKADAKFIIDTIRSGNWPSNDELCAAFLSNTAQTLKADSLARMNGLANDVSFSALPESFTSSLKLNLSLLSALGLTSHVVEIANALNEELQPQALNRNNLLPATPVVMATLGAMLDTNDIGIATAAAELLTTLASWPLVAPSPQRQRPHQPQHARPPHLPQQNESVQPSNVKESLIEFRKALHANGAWHSKLAEWVVSTNTQAEAPSHKFYLAAVLVSNELYHTGEVNQRLFDIIKQGLNSNSYRERHAAVTATKYLTHPKFGGDLKTPLLNIVAEIPTGSSANPQAQFQADYLALEAARSLSLFPVEVFCVDRDGLPTVADDFITKLKGALVRFDRWQSAAGLLVMYAPYMNEKQLERLASDVTVDSQYRILAMVIANSTALGEREQATWDKIVATRDNFEVFPVTFTPQIEQKTAGLTSTIDSLAVHLANFDRSISTELARTDPDMRKVKQWRVDRRTMAERSREFEARVDAIRNPAHLIDAAQKWREVMLDLRAEDAASILMGLEGLRKITDGSSILRNLHELGHPNPQWATAHLDQLLNDLSSMDIDAEIRAIIRGECLDILRKFVSHDAWSVICKHFPDSAYNPPFEQWQSPVTVLLALD